MKPNKRPIDFTDDDEYLESLYPVVSSTDCTGLSPFAVRHKEEEDSYKELYNIPLSYDKNLLDPDYNEDFR